MDVQCHIGMVDAYRGALSCLFTEIVHNGVFYFVGYELGVTELVRENHSVYGKTFIFIQEVGRRMVAFTGDKEMMYRANFCLRTASTSFKGASTASWR